MTGSSDGTVPARPPGAPGGVPAPATGPPGGAPTPATGPPGGAPTPPTGSAPAMTDPVSVIRSRQYLSALVLAALIGLPISAIAYGYLAAVTWLQDTIFTSMPESLFGGEVPAWWPVPWLALSGLLCALAIQYLPGNGGHSPALGFVAGGFPSARELPAIVLASLASLSLGAVVGPEAPLIAIGGGLGAIAIRAVKRDSPATSVAVIASAGMFAAISTLLGSPLLGAFLIMEAAGIGGATLGLIVLPGMLAAGIGDLIFVGLGSWTGLGTFSLTLPHVPGVESPSLATFGYALAFGVVASGLGWLIKHLALSIRPIVHRGRIPVTIGLGVLVGLIAMLFQLISGQPNILVLFSGQDALPGLIGEATTLSVGVLLLLLVAKSLAYGLSLAAFRGGPVFPSMLIGATLGMVAAGLPGMNLGAGIAMGIGAMCTAMLKLPLTSILLATLLLGYDGITSMPVVIVAVVAAYVATAFLPDPVKAAKAKEAAAAAAPSAESG